MASRDAGFEGIMQIAGLAESLKDIQVKLSRYEEESQKQKEQIARLEEFNAELIKANGISQQECEKLRRENEVMQENYQGSSSDQNNKLPSLKIWQQETQQLRSQVQNLEEECQRLRAKLQQRSSSSCCSQLCWYLFGKKTSNENLLENE